MKPAPAAAAAAAAPAAAAPPRAIGSSRAATPAATARSPAPTAPLPVYDLNGRPLGFFPLAPGIDASALVSSMPPVAAAATPAAAAAAAIAMAAAATPGRAPLQPRHAAPPPQAPAPAPASISAADLEMYQRFLQFQQMQQMASAASAPAAAPSPAAAAPRPAADVTASSHAVTEALASMFSQRGPGGTAVSAMGGASPRQPRLAKDAASAPKDMPTAPTPAVVVAGGDVAVPAGAHHVSAQVLVPASAGGRGSDVPGSGDTSATPALASPAAVASSTPYMYSLAATGDQLSQLSEARVLAETRVRELEKKLRQAQARGAVLEKDLQDACAELDGKDSELRRLRRIERASNQRPEVMASLLLQPGAGTGGAAAAVSAAAAAGAGPGGAAAVLGLPLPLSAAGPAQDRAAWFELTRRLPLLQGFPEAVVLEVLQHARALALPAGAAVSECSAARDSVLVLLEGSVLLRPAPAADSGGGGAGGGSGAATAAEQAPSLSAPAALALGAGDFLCEHTVLNRAPRAAWRDPARWVARADVALLALPAALLRRLLLTESALLDSWSEAALAAAVSPAYSPLRPPPRAALHADAGAAALVGHASLLRALLHLAQGRHVSDALLAEKRAVARRAGAGELLGASAAPSSTSSAAASSAADDEDDMLIAGEAGAAERAAAAVPAHLAAGAPMLAFLAHAAAHASPAGGAPTERAIEAVVSAARLFFGCAAAALFEVDDSPRAAAAAAAARVAAAGSSRLGGLQAASASAYAGPTAATAAAAAAAASTAAAAAAVATAAPQLLLRVVSVRAGALVPLAVRAEMHRPLAVAGLAGLCANTLAPVTVRDAFADARFSAAVEPLAGALGARSVLCVPVFAPPAGGERRVCAVLQLLDKGTNTAALFAPTQLRQDELVFFAEEVAGPRAGGAGSSLMSAGAGTGAADAPPLREATAVELARYPGAVAVGGQHEGLPRYPFTQRDVELAELAARRIGDCVAASLRQLANAASARGGAAAVLRPGTSADAGMDDGPDDAASTSIHDDSVDVPGMSSGRDSGAAAAAATSSSVAATGADADEAAPPQGAPAAAAARTVPLHSVSDVLQWRARSLYAALPLASLASPLALGGGEDEYGDAMAPVAQYPPPPTALLNGGSAGLADGADLDEASAPGAATFGSSPGAATFVPGGADAAGALLGGVGVDAAVPSSIYVYVRACLCVGRNPVTPDSSSPSARAVNGFASGRVANGPGSGDGARAAGVSSAAAEGCTANWAAAGAAEGSEARGFIDLDARVCDLPRDAQVIFAVHEEPSPDADADEANASGGRPLFWASCLLFAPGSATLRTGTVLLPLHVGAWPGVVSGGADDDADASRLGVLEVDLGSVGVPPGATVVDCDLPRGGWATWRGPALALGLRLPRGAASAVSAFASAAAAAAARPLLSPTKPAGRGAATESAVSALMFAGEELVLDSAPAGVGGAFAAARRAPVPPAPSYAMAPAALSMTVGGDARGSQPLRVPSLQSASPMIPLPASAPFAQGGAGFGAFAPPGTFMPRGAAVQRVSPGVESLTTRELALTRALQAGLPAADVHWPHRPTPQLRRVLWRYRRQFLAAAGARVLPALLKAAPFLYALPDPGRAFDLGGDGRGAGAGGVGDDGAAELEPGFAAVRAAQALVREAGALPAHVALMLLDIADPAVRSLALESLAARFGTDAEEAASASALLPSLALAAVSDQHLDSIVARLLLSLAVEAPLSIGRQLAWEWRAMLGATGLRGRCARLLRALLDTQDEFATPELALQSFALTQVAAACRRASGGAGSAAGGGGASGPGGSGGGTLAARSQALRGALSSVVLPHTLRLPLRAEAPVVPSAWYRAQVDGSLSAAFAALTEAELMQTPMAGEGEIAASEESEGGGRAGDVVGAQAHALAHAGSALSTAAATRGGDAASEDDDDDSGDDVAKGGAAPTPTPSPSALAAALVQELEDAVSVSLAGLGAFSDASAFGLAGEEFRSPTVALALLTSAARAATAAAAARLAPAGGGAAGEADPRLPVCGPSLRVATCAAAAGLDGASGAVRAALPYTAAFVAAVSEAARAARAARAVAAEAAAAAAAREEADAGEAALRILAQMRASLSGGGAGGGSGGGAATPGPVAMAMAAAAAQQQQKEPPSPPSPRAPPPAPPAPTAALPLGGLCVGDLVPPACRVLSCNARRRQARVLLVFALAADPDAARGAVPLPLPAAPPGVVRVDVHVPRPLRFRDNRVHVVAFAGDDAAVASEALNAQLLGSFGRAWREAGLTVGDAVGAVASGAFFSASRDPAVVSAVAAAAGAGGAGGDLGALPGRLTGLLLAPAGALTLAEVFGEASPHGALPRWFLRGIWAQQRDEDADAATAAATAAAAAPASGEGEGEYASIVALYRDSLAAAVAAAYALALGPRDAEGIFVTPAGHVSLAALDFADAAPDRFLHSLDDREHLRARFAAGGLTAELCAVLGRGGRAELAGLVAEALVALRRRPDEALALLGAQLALHLAGAATPRDVGSLRARLLLHVDDDAVARAMFEERATRFLSLE